MGHQYIIFLYEIKESLEIKRSRVTYFRKCKMNKTKYNKDTLRALTKTEIERSDLGFKAFKNVRGTMPYFEAKNKVITDEEINSMTKEEKKKLIKKYPIDVVNYLDALFRHHINSMKKNISFGKYHIEDYFYRVEFEQRGSAHIHCVFWIQTKEGLIPPKVFLEESPDEDVREDQKLRFVEYFDSIVSASLSHEGVDNDAIEYQKHRHTFSCYKHKKGSIVIKETEGFGKHTWHGESKYS